MMSNGIMTIKIVMIISSMRRGGRERVALDVLTGLDNTRFDPLLVVMKNGDLLDEAPPERVRARLAAFRGDVAGYTWRLWWLLRREQPQLIICVGNRWDSAVARLLAPLAGVRAVVLELHGVLDPHTAQMTPFDRWLKPLTTHYIAIGEHMQTYLREREGIPPQAITLIPNGIDTARYQPLGKDARRDGRQQHFGLTGTEPLVGCVAGLRPEKNHALLLRAFARLLSTLPDAQLVLVGDGTERARIQATIAELKLDARVHVLGQRADVADLMPLFDIHVLSSHTEAAPLVILEAGACGVPTVSTRVGGVPDLIAHGETGWLTPPHDADALAAGMHRLLSDSAERQRLGAALRQQVLARYSLRAALVAREALFERLVTPHEPKIGSR